MLKTFLSFQILFYKEKSSTFKHSTASIPSEQNHLKFAVLLGRGYELQSFKIQAYYLFI